MKGHKGLLYIDIAEPLLIADQLKVIVPTVVAPINSWNKADYYWVDPQGNERMIERKQISEALSDLNAVEDQLGRHLHECAELTLLVEGVALASPKGVRTYQLQKRVWREDYEHRNQPTLWSRWNSFKYSLWHNAGVHVEEVSHWTGSVEHITTAYLKSMDPSSTTLNRYVVPHMPPFHKNPLIDNLCRLKGMGMGEKTAILLVEVEKLDTWHRIMTAPYAQYVGIMGGAWTRTFFEAIGRED